jgi:hypothetical protein
VAIAFELLTHSLSTTPTLHIHIRIRIRIHTRY